MTEALGADVYFAHPYCSWERGLNENTNGLIRQYFTKSSSFENITDADVAVVMNKLNHRPRKTLNFKTPALVQFDKFISYCLLTDVTHFPLKVRMILG